LCQRSQAAWRETFSSAAIRSQGIPSSRAWLALERLEIGDEDVRLIERLAAAEDVAVRLQEVLDHDQLELLQSRIVEERAYADIAQELECWKAVVRKRVSRALALARLAIGGSP
jgi:DNA-directed RNA polymerase specialized sigma24 family protein